MNLLNLLSLSLILPATFALAADGSFDKTLTLQGAPTVSIFTNSGYVHVFPGSENQVHIIGHVHVHRGWFGPGADSIVKQVLSSPPIVQSGNTVTVGPSHGDHSLFRDVSIDYDITTPHATTLKANTGSGSIEIGGIESTVIAESGSGSIHVDNIGPNVHLNTGSGSIQATNVHGAASLDTGSGNLELSLTAPGEVKAHTGSGSIRIDGVSGGLRATADSGSIEVAGNPAAEWRLECGSGNIHLHLAPNSHFILNASTGSGSVHVDMPLVAQGDHNEHQVSGPVNGGGPTLRATTGSGSITVR